MSQEKKPYWFPVQATDRDDAQQLNYEFVVNDDGLPRKLGDGTFGAVFQVLSPERERAAVKLFYPAADWSVTDTRNRKEMRAGSDVREALRSVNLESLLANLVLSKGWTTEFHDSGAYKQLTDAFARLGLVVSPIALVMPYFECTLKDLLESGGPKGRLVRSAPAKNPGAPGYEILGRMALPERERQIATIMGQIVTGLRALHAAKLFHRDIKPANVMMGVSGNDVEAALADFGFIDDLPERTMSGYGGALPLGTRHYRSPEQKDYFDLCDVSVTPKDKGGTKRLILETTDKKFADTLIERGDIAEFSKDKHGEADRATGYMVEDVVPGDKKSTIILENPFEMSFADEKTQVLFYKKPSARTDLFGVGALMFDMLTLGKSPECFYDYLRPLDRHNPEGSEASSVNTLVEKYRAAVNGNTTSAELASILDQVRNNALGHYPSSEFMAIVFRCMMSRSRGSYFETEQKPPKHPKSATADPDEPNSRSAEEPPKHNVFDRILEDLKGLPSLRGRAEISSSPSGLPRFPTEGPLWSGEAVDGGRSDSGASFDEGLRRAYGWGSGMERFEWAARRLDRISNAIANICQQDNFYVDIGPNNLQVNNNDTEIRPLIATYRTEDQYLSAVLTGSAWSLETGGATNNLTPLFTRFNIRAIRLDLGKRPEDGDNIQAKVSYTESLPVWRGCAEGDFFRVVDSSGRPGLFEIERVKQSGGMLDISAKPRKVGEGFSLGTNDTRYDGLAIRRLDPRRCYLSMLATYLHHLFFVDDRSDTGVIPDEAWDYLKKITGESNQDADRGKLTGIGKITGILPKRKLAGIDRVRFSIAKLYMKLIRLSERPRSDGETTLIGGMQSDVDLLLDEIARVAGHGDRRGLMNSPEQAPGGMGQTDYGREEGRQFSEVLRDAQKL